MRNGIEEAVLIAEAETGTNTVPLCMASSIQKKPLSWTKEDEDFIRDNYTRVPEEEIARQLGRTSISVHLHREREMHLSGMSKDQDILTAEQVANGLGLDGKSVHLLMDTGRMPCRHLPSVRIIRVIDRHIFMRWMLDPENWLYFKIDRVGALCRRGKRRLSIHYDFAFWEATRELILKARHKCKDQWLTPGQVVKLLKINPKATKRRKLVYKVPGVRYVNKAILKGNLKAKRWGNWWIKKSDLPGKGKTINFKGEIVHR